MPKQLEPVLQPIQPAGTPRATAQASRVARQRGRPIALTDMQLLIASIAHEVSQPLTGILTNANACRRMLTGDRPNIDGAAETARRTIRDVQRAVDLINRLRALFTLRRPVIEPVSLNEAVLEVLALSRGELEHFQVMVRCNLRDDAPLTLGDRVLLQQVILNLIRNALEAMSGTAHGPRIVTIETWQDEYGQSRLSVHDVGPGISSRDAEKIFKPLYSTKPEGMGMGLCISRTIVERHGGRLWATPNNDVGTTFWLSMPSQRHASAKARMGPPQADSRACQGRLPTAQAM